MKKTKILIVHYNTPVLIDKLIRSINKTTPNADIYVFDNSDAKPFENIHGNVTLFDNTKGQYIDFDKWLSGYPTHLTSGAVHNRWASAKHAYTIQYCMDNLIKDEFVLLDSDVLVKKDLSELVDSSMCFCGTVEPESIDHMDIIRIPPFVCYINVKMCHENGVTYFNPNYMHGINAGVDKNSDHADTGAWFYLSSIKLPRREIRWWDYVVHLGNASWKSNAMMADRAERWLKNNEKFWAGDGLVVPVGKKNVVYTCITGGYDILDDPSEVSPDFDYVCFTDSEEMKSNVWKFRPIPKELEGLSNVKKQRCIKICPHRFLPEYNLSIWIDGSVLVLKDPMPFINKTCANGSVFIPKHPARNCIYTEEIAVLKMHKDSKDITGPQMRRYMEEGFPKNYGLVQSNIIIRRHNDDGCKRLMETWWKEVENGSHRDQLSFNYAVWKNQDVPVSIIDKKTCKSEYFNWDQTHGRKRKRNTIPTLVDMGISPERIKTPQKPVQAVRKSSVNGQSNHSVSKKILSRTLRTFINSH